MTLHSEIQIEGSEYDRNACKIGIVHLGFGAFHRAHQAVFVDDYMAQSGDLNWGVAAVNLRKEDTVAFKNLAEDSNGYLLMTTSPNGESSLRKVRPHIHYSDWSTSPDEAENLLCLESVKAITITVTESGYYLDDDCRLNKNSLVIADEIAGKSKRSVYAYLATALAKRIATTNQPISILCCDNIRSNGDVLKASFRDYLEATGKANIAAWLEENASFPNSMVDRITPRPSPAIRSEIAAFSPQLEANAIHSESFIEWVLEDNFATDFPALDKVGVKFVKDVHPYEEAKIRILNGGHTALCYLGALCGHHTFDQAINDPALREHFLGYQLENVLPGITLDLPFDKRKYLQQTTDRFSNKAIADDLGRICMDGWTKFPIFILPTIATCLKQNIVPKFGYGSIASWYVYARHFAAGKSHIPYIDPYWDQLAPLLERGQERKFATLEALWSDLPETYPDFVSHLCSAIEQVEEKWPS